MRYERDILTPWGHDAPTGYTYILTKKKVNEIYCKMAFPVTPLQQLEIDTFRNFLLGLKNAGVNVPVVNPNVNLFGTTTIPVLDNTIIGQDTTTSPIISSILSRLTANVRSAMNWSYTHFCTWFNLLLILIIIILSYLLYRERLNSKKLEDINKELSLK